LHSYDLSLDLPTLRIETFSELSDLVSKGDKLTGSISFPSTNDILFLMSHPSYTGGPVENGYGNGNGAGTSMSASLSPNGKQRGLSQQSHDMVRPLSLSCDMKTRPSG
jgi:hypothetical protein